MSEFSFRSREESLQRFENEVFDLLVIGGGITGAAVARDAVSRGLRVALVEKKDFAYGTSSRSSKLIHGGLRYLENFELKLVFEALSERTLLLKTLPHLVRPLPFVLPSYKGDQHGRWTLSLGLWLYDLLALFRSPGFHKSLSRKQLLAQFPSLNPDGLLGGFQYYDASMWDDVIAVETLRFAQAAGAAVANYIEAVEPIWNGESIAGFKVRDLSSVKNSKINTELNQPLPIELRAHQTVICTGPWTDQIGGRLGEAQSWRNWLKPSKGIHIVFDLKRFPVSSAMMMTNPEDGRIAFVIPRPDYGAGVVLVGTTDGPADKNPERVEIESAEVHYLLQLLNRYFPTLKLATEDILSGYVGVRPLMGGDTSSPAAQGETTVLQKVSREHHIAPGPGGTVIVAGGKYTTHRKMGEEIVDFTLAQWKKNSKKSKNGDLAYPRKIGPSNTRGTINPRASTEAVALARMEASSNGWVLPEQLVSRYGAEALTILSLERSRQASPEGFPELEAQLRYCIRHEMVMHLEDFYLRRVPLYIARKDHGLPWAEALVQVWAQETGQSPSDAVLELANLKQELDRRSHWQNSLTL